MVDLSALRLRAPPAAVFRAKFLRISGEDRFFQDLTARRGGKPTAATADGGGGGGARFLPLNDVEKCGVGCGVIGVADTDGHVKTFSSSNSTEDEDDGDGDDGRADGSGECRELAVRDLRLY